MFETVYSDIKSAIATVAEGLGVGAEHVYEVLVRQQMIDSISISILIVLMGVMATLLLRLPMNKKNQYHWSDGDLKGWNVKGTVGVIVGSICLLIFFIVFIMEGANVITGFLNPEYSAMQEIFKLIK